MISWEFLEARLVQLEEAGLFRRPDDGANRLECWRHAEALNVEPIDACSNDYLGYSRTVVSRETSQLESTTGSGASRLIHGTRQIHQDLEAHLAEWVDQQAALLFTSGYSANLGVMGSLPELGDVIFSDALNHASIIDGCRLSKAGVVVFPHLDVDSLEVMLRKESPGRRVWVVTESYFSMDGDSPDLVKLRRLCDERGAALIVDEAHSLGVFGPNGSGICRQLGVKPDVLIGTFGKALGSQGAFACSRRVARDWMWNRARSFVYSTAMSPMMAFATLSNVSRVRNDDLSRTRLADIVACFRELVTAARVPVLKSSYGPIVPIILVTPGRAMEAAKELLHRGVLVQAIREPTVRPGTSRIRLTLNSTLTDVQLQRLADAIIAVCAG